ncbi:MAG: hypothetical protein RBS56_00880 [Candidatus Gracilibacteria bacterium]|jgi:hypothetical protein|nr:hypothetical protein [Candidatus Gracilibacteria bacterium]
MEGASLNGGRYEGLTVPEKGGKKPEIIVMREKKGTERLRKEVHLAALNAIKDSERSIDDRNSSFNF